MTFSDLKRRIIPIIIGVNIVIASVLIQASMDPLIGSIRDRIEVLIYDLRLKYTLPEKPQKSKDVVIIDIDEKSLAIEGRWPWPREKISRLVDKLYQHGVAVTAFDMVFAEPENNIAEQILRSIKQKQLPGTPSELDYIEALVTRVDGDLTFSNSLKNKDMEIVLGYFFSSSGKNYGAPGRPIPISNPDDARRIKMKSVDNFTGNIPLLQQQTAYSGFINSFPDEDGVNRSYNLVVEYDGKIYPSLALEAARRLNLADDIRVLTEYDAITDSIYLTGISLGKDIDIPTDGVGAVKVPFRGPRGSFTYISATDVLNDKVDPSLLENTVALFGTSAVGLFDLRVTPVDEIYPGVEIHANVIAALLEQSYSMDRDISKLGRTVTQQFPRTTEISEGINYIVIIVVGLVFAIISTLLPPLYLVLSTAVITFGLAALNTWLWLELQLISALAIPLLMILAITLTALAWGFFFETRHKEHLKDLFGQYVPPELVNQMSETLDDASFQGERRELTVLFSDIRGFTTISESLTPKELMDLLNRFFTPMTEIIFNNQGTIDKYVGDMIMAFWGAPLRDGMHAFHGMKTALDMMARVGHIKKQFEERGLPEVNIGIGINTGMMSVGDMGSAFRRAYTVIGDQVNLGSRLEGLTKFYGVDIIVGDNTRHSPRNDEFVFRKLDLVRVKGKHEPVTIYELVCMASDADSEMLARLQDYHDALTLYHSRKWHTARNLFEELATREPDRLIYQIFLERMNKAAMAALPEIWDGVFDHISK